MDKSKTLKLTLFGLALALAFGGGALVAFLGGDGRLSYTEPGGNPSATAVRPAGDVVALPPSERRPPAGFDFADGDGRPKALGDFKGRVVLVNLWATWCTPCVAEMPALNALAGKLGGPGFEVVAVSLDRGGAGVAKRFLTNRNLAHLGVYAASPVQFPNALLPTSLLLDKQGRVAWQGTGVRDWEGEEAEKVVRALMAE